MRNLLAALVAICMLAACPNSRPQPDTGSSKTPNPSSSIPSLSIIYNAEEIPTEKSAVAQVLQAQLGAKGIQVKLEPLSSATYNDRVGKGEFESALTLWYLDYDDPEGYLTDFYSKAGYRLARYTRAEFDQKYLEGLFAPTLGKKLEAFKAARQLLDTELPWVPLFSNTEEFALRSGMEGFKSNSYQYYDYRQINQKIIHAATDVEVQTLDPALVYDLGSKHVATQSYEGLVAMNERNVIVPALAESWEISPDGLRLAFKIRNGVRFHAAPGTTARELTATDVKASFERMLKTTSPYTYIFDHVVGVDEYRKGTKPTVTGFITTSPAEFSIQLAKPFPTMLQWLLAPAAFILPAGTDPKFDFKHSVGTGAFVLESWDGVVAHFRRNSQYWGGGFKDGSLEIRVIKDANTALSAFKQGQLDILNIPLAAFPAMLGPDGKLTPAWKEYSLRDVPLNNLKFLAFNMEKGPWAKDATLRQRVSDAIDRNAIVQQLLRGKGRIATSVIPSGVAGF